MALFERTNTIATQLDDPYWIAISSNNIANVQLELEQFEEAADTLREVVAMCGRIGIAGTQGDALRGLSHAHRGRGRPDEAQVAVHQALDIAREHENSAWEAHWLLELSRVQMDLDEPGEALVSCQRAAALQRQLGDRLREACAFDATGAAYQVIGRHDEAVDFHRLAITVFREHKDQWRLALALEQLGAALSAREAFGEATAHRQEALQIARTFNDPQARRLQIRLTTKLGR
jgi:tetratricopeptide (TPR) repeat protein